MRWHIQGTDALTGDHVELASDHADASTAIQSAMDRRILVSQVRPGTRAGRPRFLVPLTLALLIALGATATGLYLQNQSLRGSLDQAVAEQNRLANAVARAQQTFANISSSGTLAHDAAAQVSQLASQLADARSRMSLTQQELSVAHQQVNALQQFSQKVPTLESQLQTANQQLADAQKQLAANQILMAQLRAQITLQDRRLDSLQNAATQSAAAQLAALQKANADLSDQVEKLKAELLVLAARTPAPLPAAPADPPPAPPGNMRWALPIAYDTAQAFLVLHADSNILTPVTQPDQLMATSALLASHAVKMTLLHDRARERVYSVTLSVSLASDAPPVILNDNKALIVDFLHTCAPALKDPAPVLAAAADLAGQGSSHRHVFLADDAKITLWNDATGVYTIKVESSHEDRPG